MLDIWSYDKSPGKSNFFRGDLDLRRNDFRFRVLYRNSNRVNNSRTDLAMAVRFFKIIEYKENGATPGYQSGEELSTYDIGFKSNGWRDITRSTHIDSVTGNQVNVFNIRTVDNVFGITLKIAAGLVDLSDGTQLPPNAVKMDVTIDNFPYTAASGSSLALVSALVTRQSIKERSFDYDIDGNVVGANVYVNKQIQAGGAAIGDPQAIFAWSDLISADGNDLTVIPSAITQIPAGAAGAPIATADPLMKNAISRKVVFSFPSANNTKAFWWDPSTGVDITTQLPTSSATSNSVSLVAALTGLIVSLFVAHNA